MVCTVHTSGGDCSARASTGRKGNLTAPTRTQHGKCFNTNQVAFHSASSKYLFWILCRSWWGL